MFRNKLRYSVNAVIRFKKSFEIYRTVEYPIQILNIADALRFDDVQELFLKQLFGKANVVSCQRVTELHGGPVLDRLTNRVLIEVSAIVLLSEYFERSFAVCRFINRRSSEADERCIG